MHCIHDMVTYRYRFFSEIGAIAKVLYSIVYFIGSEGIGIFLLNGLQIMELVSKKMKNFRIFRTKNLQKKRKII